MTETCVEGEELQPSGESSTSPQVVGGSPEPGRDSPLLYRAAGEITDVSWPERTLEVVAHPYNAEAIVEWQGRMVAESCDPGAYNGIQRRAERIWVCRDHDRARTVGRTRALHPERDEGLVATLQLSRTPLAEETLALASDGVLHASVGFKPLEHSWSRDRRQVRLTKCWLQHIALTPEPAYEGADVLSVRHGDRQIAEIVARVVDAVCEPAAPVDTPHLDEVRRWLDSLH